MKRSSTIGIMLTGILFFAVAGDARPAYLQIFKRVEKPPLGSQLEKARCMTCHVKKAGGKQLNPYGEDFRVNGADEAALRKIADIDSDKDGAVNSVEIASGSLPGDPASKPEQ